MPNITSYRTCFVPLCTNTTKSTPNKVFANVPQDAKLRQKWFNAVRRDNLKSSKSNFFCCEDHFNLREDMENYQYYTMMGGPVKIKKDVVPHKFECQPDRKRRTCSAPRPASQKRQRQMEVKKILSEACETSSTNPLDKLQQTPAELLNTIPDKLAKDETGNFYVEQSTVETGRKIALSTVHECCYPIKLPITADDDKKVPLKCLCDHECNHVDRYNQ